MKTARLLVAILLASALSSLATDELAERLQPALEAITPDGLLAHIKILASDEFEGRAPGTTGEEFSLRYIADPKDSSKLDDKRFKGKAMTYYGRWTYKYEIAAKKGAAAAIIIHETEPAAYPYSVVKTSWAKENYEIDAPDKNIEAVKARSW